AAGRGDEINVFNAGTGAHIRTPIDPNLTTADQKTDKAPPPSLVESLAFSPDGKILARGSVPEVIPRGSQTATLRQKLTGFADRVVALAFSADNKLLATGGGPPTEDGEVKVFDVATGKPVVDIKNGHSDQVFGVAFSPDGTKLASCGSDKFVKVFE